ncbi:hypothetical protein BCR37DRAFT_390353 [Protomyces lactucae-debilis]|uniref:Uncharacterized protein n=1 Tax=Protomyces lactucae-debilis TaxID=2754530 RepID=A0A1Y2FV11_PROLT|nr:uncharacterized protein BCR37DRAFT_390353 [Protomyces lactucae-debilis]ORY87838.1 hypothetical protein BCR37DRAFT_390353 [Protomyces lactucae-debilis]
MSRDPVRDIVRGLTTLEMTLINLSQTKALAHSGYIDQITYADTIFPTFAFLAGMSPSPVRRSVGLVGLGLALNAISAQAQGTPIRMLGVLQRLGLSLLLINGPARSLLCRFNGIPLLLAWYAISLGFADNAFNPFAHPDYRDPDPSKTAQSKLDMGLFGKRRMYTPKFDPEGLLGTLTTAFSMLAGSTFADSRFFNRRWKVVLSIVMLFSGNALHLLMPCYAPISKALWTPSFALVTTGVAILKYLAVAAAVPHLPDPLRRVLEATGKRPLEIYILSTLLNLVLKQVSR